MAQSVKVMPLSKREATRIRKDGVVFFTTPGFAAHGELDVTQTFPHAATIGTLRLGTAVGF